MSRVKDPDLLRALHEFWSAWGCGICRDPQIELHHVVPRGRQGADAAGNIVGLCGAFTKNHHHLEVTENRIKLTPSSGGWGWKDEVTGQWGYVSSPPELKAGADDDLPSSSVSDPSIAPPAPDVGVPEVSPPGVTVAPLTVRGPDPAGKQPATPEQRFEFLQRACSGAALAYMSIAGNLLQVEESGEWKQLGYEKWHDYWGEAGLGLPSGTVSKMLKVARFYRERWDDAVGTGASIEKLYISAQVATDPDEAIGLAASMPTFELKALAKGEPAPEDQPRCSECGQVIRASTYRGDPKKEADARSES